MFLTSLRDFVMSSFKAHSLHRPLTFSSPNTEIHISPQSYFHIHLPPCVQITEIIMRARLWARAQRAHVCACTSAVCTSLAQSKDCYKSYLPLIPQIPHTRPFAWSCSSLLKAPGGPHRHLLKWHKPEAVLLRLSVQESRRLAATSVQCLSHRAASTLPTI